MDAVHARGSYAFLQLWALGRAANSETLAKEAAKAGLPAEAYPVVSASDIPMPKNPYGDGVVPRPLTVSEIDEFVESYAVAAENAVKGAGFDGIEIHGANGYLIDQFLQTKYVWKTTYRDIEVDNFINSSNKRTDDYGGSVENRARFGLRVVDAVVSRVGPEHTAIRISPWETVQGMRMPDPVPTFTYFVQQLKARHPDLAYLHGIEGKESGDSLDFVREIWSGDGKGVFVSAGGFSRESALRLAEEKGDIVAFGKYFISNVGASVTLCYVLSGIDISPLHSPTFLADLRRTFHSLDTILTPSTHLCFRKAILTTLSRTPHHRGVGAVLTSLCFSFLAHCNHCLLSQLGINLNLREEGIRIDVEFFSIVVFVVRIYSTSAYHTAIQWAHPRK